MSGHSIEMTVNDLTVGWHCRTCQVWATWLASDAALTRMYADADRHEALPVFPPIPEGDADR